MKRLFLLFIVLIPHVVHARLQGQARVDSLLKELPAAKDDTNKVKLLDELAHGYKTINPDEGIKYGLQELELAEQLEWKKGIAWANSRLGQNNQFKYNYPKALEYLLRALKAYEELHDKGGMATIEISLANIYCQTNNYKQGLEYDLNAIKIFEQIHDKRSLATTQGNTGNVYQVMKDYTRALKYDEMALKSFEALDDKTGIARNLGNIGNIYLLQGDHSRALEYNFKALGIFEALGEKNGIGVISGNIGEIYLAIAKDTTGTIHPGNLVPPTKKATLDKAVIYLDTAIDVCSEISMLGGVMEFSTNLSEAYALKNDYKNAIRYYKTYTAVKDSVFSKDNIQKLTFIESKHEAELKEKKIEVQRLQLLADKNKQRYYIAGLGMLVLLTAGLYRRSRSARKNKKQLEEKNTVIAAEKEMADMLRLRAERSEQFKQQFLTNMSHEIRTPMNAVNGMTDLLIDKNPRPDQLHFLQVIAKSSDMLLHIINDILDLSKIENGKLELEVIDFSLAATLDHVMETLSLSAREKGLLLTTDTDKRITDVLRGDPFRLNQVLVNLGGNAVKFTEKGSIGINVKMQSEDEKNVSVLFEVTDSGIGIPQDKIPGLFESFKQVSASDSRKYGGTGLGLSISKQLVEMQGGVISVKSEYGIGSTFSFVLSYAKGSAQRMTERLLQEQKADGSLLNGLRILLVDDNEYNRMVAIETLQSKADVTIDEAENGEDAIKMIEQHNYDAVLMDIQMPVMDGLAATRYIRAKLPAPKNKIPVIALTASILRSDIDTCTDAGMDTYVPKPFKAWQLVNAIAEATGRKKKNNNS